jgi:hypothetical protein
MKTVDDLIDAWHHGQTDKPLPEYLGMTEEQYADFVVNGLGYLY